MKPVWSDSKECYCYLRNVQDLLADGKTRYESRFGEPFEGRVIPFGAMVEYFIVRPVPPFWQESFTWNIPRLFVDRGENLERRYSGRKH